MEELVVGRYTGDIPELVAVSRVREVRAFADQPAPPPSAALARVLSDPAPASNGHRPTTRPWLPAGARRSRSIPCPAVAAAVSALLVAAVIAAGRGTAILDARPGSDEWCLTLVVSDTAPVTSAHLHAGSIGVDDPVMAAFEEPAVGTPGPCVTLPHQLIKEIREDPSRYYVDVHTTELPDQALRGQLGS